MPATAEQLPASLGQKTAALSLSVVQAEDEGKPAVNRIPGVSNIAAGDVAALSVDQRGVLIVDGISRMCSLLEDMNAKLEVMAEALASLR